MTEQQVGERVGGGPRGRGRIRGVRAGWLLLLVALVPMVGVVAATSVSVADAQQRRAEVRQLERTAQRAAELVAIDGALFDEMIWRVVDETGEALGFSSDMLGLLFGTDPEAELEAADASTDELLAPEQEHELRAAVEELRSQETDLAGRLHAYGRLRDEVRSELVAMLDELDDTSGVGAAADELREAIDLLEAGIGLRGAVADAYYGYFANVFDIRDAPVVELPRLVEIRADYRRWADVLGVYAADPVAGSEVDGVLSDAALVDVAAAIDALIERSVSAGVSDQAVELSFELVMGDIDGLTATYRAAAASTSATLGLLDIANARIADATAQVVGDVEQDVTRTYLLVGTLVVATLLTAFSAARFIVRPLRKLKDAVDRLHDGDPVADVVSTSGPVEVKAAAHAIRTTGEHLTRVTAQARALAAGDLTADVLESRVDGGLGDAVQDAVDRLRDALTQQDEFRRRLTHEASHDGLTQVPNRNAAMAHLARSLARAKRAGTQLALLFVDLDHFKDVNDQHGHHAGDVVLTTTAHRLVNTVREDDFVARLGGDEFVVIAEAIDGIDDAIRLAQRLLDALAAPIEIDTEPTTIQASIGIALADAHHLTADELLRDADLAVYRAKETGRSGIEICDEDLRQQVAEDADMTSAIGRAIANDEFVIHYQPVVSTTDNSIQSLEALVRWHRADTGELVPPGHFIGFAERSSLIVDIDRWVINAVIEQLAAWQHHPHFANTPVAVNLSGRHLLHHDVIAHILEPLDRHNVDPQLLIVELTESVFLDDLDTAAHRLNQLRELGVRTAIDDFGTGYTSLAHLRTLPVDILKIDRTFTATATTDTNEASIVKLIVDAGHLLGATVTAEGIETATEAQRLIDLGSDHLQGFYFARPQPADTLPTPTHQN